MKKLISFKEIDRARKTLDLGVVTSIKEIKDNYRKLSLKYHPDRHVNSSKRNKYEEKMGEINNSYQILLDYCMKYPISLDEKEVVKIEEGEYNKQHYNKFYKDWLGGKD